MKRNRRGVGHPIPASRISDHSFPSESLRSWVSIPSPIPALSGPIHLHHSARRAPPDSRDSGKPNPKGIFLPIIFLPKIRNRGGFRWPSHSLANLPETRPPSRPLLSSIRGIRTIRGSISLPVPQCTSPKTSPKIAGRGACGPSSFPAFNRANECRNSPETFPK